MKGLSKKIHVNQHKIKSNRKNGTNEPVFTCKTYKSNDFGHSAIVCCPSCDGAVLELKYRPEKPLECGAEVWIETKGMVVIQNGEETKVVD